MIVPLLELVFILGATEYATCWLPEIGPLPVSVMKLALVTAFQEQPAAVVTENIASPPADPNDKDELRAENAALMMGVTVYEQLGGGLVGTGVRTRTTLLYESAK